MQDWLELGQDAQHYLDYSIELVLALSERLVQLERRRRWLSLSLEPEWNFD
ncbi:hypothetical protein D3C80_2020840 [compost metagenome]